LLLTEADFANLSLFGQARLEHLLKRAIVVSSDAVPAETITMNTEVLLCDDATGERRVVRVVYPADADASQGLISVLQPLGTALLGASVGQVIDCRLAGGPRGLRVDKIIFQPEQSLRTQLVVSGWAAEQA